MADAVRPHGEFHSSQYKGPFVRRTSGATVISITSPLAKTRQNGLTPSERWIPLMHVSTRMPRQAEQRIYCSVCKKHGGHANNAQHQLVQALQEG